jgi:hypothetical protein
MAVTHTISVNYEVKEVSSDGKSVGQDKFTFNKTYTFANAAGVLGATKMWADTRTLTGTESLDLAGGVVDKLGNTETFTKGKSFLCHHDGATGTLTLGAGSTPWIGMITGTIILGADGLCLIVNPTSAGGAVVAGTGDLLQVVASVAATDYDIALAGE